MNKNLQLIPTKDMTREEWLRYRMSGIGASEIGCILGLSPYKSSIELFYEKIGESVRPDFQSIFMFMGTYQEDTVADLWQYWEGSEETMMANYAADNIIRKCQRVNAYVRNPKWPWLFVSLDRKINKTPQRGEGALEIKTLSGYEADKWAAGIPPSHVVQVQDQIGVCEFDFGELAILKDGRRFEVIPFERNVAIWEGILERTKEFWDKVLEGRKIMTVRFEAERNFNMKVVNECNAAIHALEPAPDGSDAYLQYMKEKFHLAPPGEKAGTETELAWARSHKTLKGQIKDLEEAARAEQNKMVRFLDGMDKIDFGANGFVSWSANINGVRTFRNSVK